MIKRTLALAAVLLACVGITMIGCEKVNGPSSVTDDTLSITGSFDVTTLDGQTTLLKSAGVNTDSANAFFVLRWSQGLEHFLSIDTVMAHASAVLYAQPATLRDRNAVGLNMGTVSVIAGPDTFDLYKFVKHVFGVRYGMFGGPVGTLARCGGLAGPFGRHSGPGHFWFGPHNRHAGRADSLLKIVNIPYVGGETYQFAVSGADSIPALLLDIQAPAKLVQITTPANKDSIDATQDLTVAWDGDPAANNTVLVLQPLFFHKHNGQGAAQTIFMKVDAAAGSYTIPAQTLQDMLAAANGNTKVLSLHLAQGKVGEVNSPDVGKILVSAGADDKAILFVK